MNEKEKRFTQVCIKLDELRFKKPIDQGGINIKGIKPSEEIFLFWLCSIIDQFYPYQTIWENGKKAMLNILKTNPKSFDDVKKTMRNIRKDRKGNFVADIPTDNENTFTLVRDDFERIEKTFNFLSTYENDKNENIPFRFIKLLGNCILKFQGNGGIRKLAYYLNSCLWESSPDESFPENEIIKFLDKPRKRLWMFIMFLRRDPFLLNLFRDALIEVYGELEGKKIFSIWENNEKFDPKEIELPGDMWNIRLFQYLKISSKNAKKKARELASEFGVSPSIFDVTFAIGAEKCKEGGCDEWLNCPFGDNKVCHKGKEKFCSVAQWLFEDNKILCDPENCPIGRNLGRKMCQESKNKRLTDYYSK
ncbi:MAG: hypothetical protein QW758_00465 [Candidatus Aenigmatarchaeota archaeon]